MNFKMCEANEPQKKCGDYKEGREKINNAKALSFPEIRPFCARNL